MSMEMDEPLDSFLGEIKELEQDIALADYELRNDPPTYFIILPIVPYVNSLS